MNKTSKICSQMCCGSIGLAGACCFIEDRDWIIGPHQDTEEFINRLSIKFDREIFREEIFIEYKEGKNLFPDKSHWQNQENYPALRVNINISRYPCIFYNTSLKLCSIYDIRPKICKDYKCDYLRENE
jgi:Fe-S-cluster containining protein